MRRVPKVIVVAGDTPANVDAATRAFGSPLRVHLIRHYLATPGPQKAAIEQLQITQRAVSINTRELVATGVVVEEPAEDRRSRTYRVDVERLDELLTAIRDFAATRP
jgi:DNA-binding MarR family transcriptional regulator